MCSVAHGCTSHSRRVVRSAEVRTVGSSAATCSRARTVVNSLLMTAPVFLLHHTTLKTGGGGRRGGGIHGSAAEGLQRQTPGPRHSCCKNPSCILLDPSWKKPSLLRAC